MSVEPRRIKKIVRASDKPPFDYSQEEMRNAERRPDVFPDVPAGDYGSRHEAPRTAGLPEASIQKITRKAGAKKKVYRTRKVSEGHVYALTKPRSVEGYVTLTQLASERGIQPQLARIWAKKAGWTPTADGWRFKEGSRDLKRIRKVLGLEP